MNLTHKIGNLFETNVIAHGCNAQGVMGSGVALQMKNLHPKAYEVYKSAPMTMGSISHVSCDGKLIINMITQQRYGKAGVRYVDYEAIAEAFFLTGNLLQRHTLTTLNIPLIGAGLGGGNWDIIELIIRDTLKGMPLDVVVWRLEV